LDFALLTIHTERRTAMPKQVLFIQGAGQGAYEADAKLVGSLRHELGPDYEVGFPSMPNEADAQYDEWKLRIQKELHAIPEPIILVAHSVGASILLKCLSEITVQKQLAGIFLMATPFWGGNGWLYEGYEKLELPRDLQAKLPHGMAVFLYHCQDDDTVPYGHLALYATLLPQAAERQLKQGGHLFNDDLRCVADDIKNLRL
jgi:predicted alpha/beta hydrolase family esterase